MVTLSRTFALNVWGDISTTSKRFPNLLYPLWLRGACWLCLRLSIVVFIGVFLVNEWHVYIHSCLSWDLNNRRNIKKGQKHFWIILIYLSVPFLRIRVYHFQLWLHFFMGHGSLASNKIVIWRRVLSSETTY